MSVVEKLSSVHGYARVFIPATALSLLTLFLVESPICYLLIIFEVSSIAVIFLLLQSDGRDFAWGFELPQCHNHIVNLILILLPIALIALTALESEIDPLLPLLTLIVISLQPGYCILGITGVSRRFSRLEVLVLSFVTSYILTGSLWFVLLPLNVQTRPIILLLSYVVLGLLFGFNQSNEDVTSERYSSFSRPVDAIAIIIALTFFVLSFSLIYPGFALLPNTDISRHYAHSIVLGITPDLYNGQNYLMAHLHESAFLYSSNPSLITAQTALALLNLFLPLSLYVTTKRLLGNRDKRIPALATLFWSLFTNGFGGFAWIPFVLIRIINPELTQLGSLVMAGGITYNGTYYGLLGLWYVPIGVAFVIFMILISLLVNHSLSRKSFLVLFSTLFAGMYLTHAPEAVILGSFLASYGLFTKAKSFRLDEGLVGAFAGLLIASGVYGILSQFLVRFSFGTSNLQSLLLPLSLLGAVIGVRKLLGGEMFIDRLSLSSISSRNRAVSILMNIVVLVYFVSFFAWSTAVWEFRTSQVDAVGLVPWFLYPMMLGMNGLLGVLSLFSMRASRRYKEDKFSFLLLLIVFLILLGRMVSFVNVFLFFSGYWEKRFIFLIKIPLAMIASITLVAITDNSRLFQYTMNRKTLAGALMISTIVVAGFSTTALNLEYWHVISHTSPMIPSEAEHDAIDSLRQLIAQDPRCWLATLTRTSSGMVTFAAPAEKIIFQEVLYTAQNPEMILAQLYRHPSYSHPYIYAASRDFDALDGFPNSLFREYIDGLPIEFINSEVTIYNSIRPSFPLANSETKLIVPFDKFLSDLQLISAYQALSGISAEYTMLYDLDDSAIEATNQVLSFDPPQSHSLHLVLTDDFENPTTEMQYRGGTWYVEDGALHCGSIDELSPGIALFPDRMSELNVTVLFRPLQSPSGELCYTGLVHSFQNSNNYKQAELLFNDDGYIYLLTRTIDGTHWTNGSCNPRWPGHNTGVQWTLGDEFSLRFEITKESTTVSINDVEHLAINSTNPKGKAGLWYARFQRAAFDDLGMNGSLSLVLRPTDEYLEYVENGGNLTVLNTNGYHFFSEMMLNPENYTTMAQGVVGELIDIAFPEDITVQMMVPSDPDTEVLASYISATGNVSPFAVRKRIGEGELLYVNIFPIIEAVENNEVSFPSFSILGQALEFMNLPAMNPELIELDGYIKSARLEEVNMSTRWIQFPLDLCIHSLMLIDDGESYAFSNVTEIHLTSASLILNSDSGLLENGRGLYSSFHLNSTFEISPNHGEMQVRLKSHNTIFFYDSVSSTVLTPGAAIKLHVRTPLVQASSAVLSELHAAGGLRWKTSASGQDLHVIDGISFQVVISDSYTMIKGVLFAGDWYLVPPLVQFNELGTFNHAMIWCLVLLPVAFILMNRASISMMSLRLRRALRRRFGTNTT